jgi:3-deoxy-D-manno-octulosonate 8-phosphate phosphatase (KDO 8-P phosphatase)
LVQNSRYEDGTTKNRSIVFSVVPYSYVGDDLPDLPVMRRVGLAVAVGNAVREVKETAHYTTNALAGHGAIRETVELILKSKGIWDSIIDKARA